MVWHAEHDWCTANGSSGNNDGAGTARRTAIGDCPILTTALLFMESTSSDTIPNRMPTCAPAMNGYACLKWPTQSVRNDTKAMQQRAMPVHLSHSALPVI